MTEALFYLDPDSGLSLQNQIRQKLVDAVLSGAFPPGGRLPSSRKLAEQLSVARNTVVLAYEQLIEEGLLESRERSGILSAKRSLTAESGSTGLPNGKRVKTENGGKESAPRQAGTPASSSLTTGSNTPTRLSTVSSMPRSSPRLSGGKQAAWHWGRVSCGKAR